MILATRCSSSLSVSLVVLCCAGATATADSSVVAQRIAPVVEVAAREGFAGCVLVRDGKVIALERAVGAVDRDGQVPATIDTVFGVASVSKQFAAVAILQLEEAERLKLNDPITRFIPDAPEDKRAITLHHLLTHTAGLGEDYAADEKSDRNEAIRAILAVPLESAVGERFGYSNDGYTLLAAIVEIVSGVDYDKYLHDRIFEPAGMARTCVWRELADRKPPDVADLLRDISRVGDAINWGFRGPSGVHTTIHDLDRYWSALHSGKLISGKNLDRMFTPYSKTRIGPYGYGWFVDSRDASERRWMTRGNEDFGPNGMIIVHPDRSLVIIVLSHRFLTSGDRAARSDVPWSRRLSEEIEKALEGDER